MASLLSIHFDIAQRRKRFTPRPVTYVTLQAGDVVAYRSLGKLHTGEIEEVRDYFGQAAYLVNGVLISGGQVIGLAGMEMVA